MLQEGHLTPSEQEKAIGVIRSTYDTLLHEYRDAKASNQVNEEVEGHLHKLGMKLDGMETSVQEAVRISQQRKPYQG